MYKVFINQNVLTFTDTELGNDAKALDIEFSKTALHQWFTQVFDNSRSEIFYIKTSNPKQKFEALLEYFQIVKAAGGAVHSPNNELLWIKRNGIWDLPKGKVEKGEEIKTAAIREVEEECGIGDLSIESELLTTYHYYFREGHIIKPTFWFKMKTASTQVPTPQVEEGITDVAWKNKSESLDCLQNTYASVAEMLKSSSVLA